MRRLRPCAHKLCADWIPWKLNPRRQSCHCRPSPTEPLLVTAWLYVILVYKHTQMKNKTVTETDTMDQVKDAAWWEELWRVAFWCQSQCSDYRWHLVSYCFLLCVFAIVVVVDVPSLLIQWRKCVVKTVMAWNVGLKCVHFCIKKNHIGSWVTLELV